MRYAVTHRTTYTYDAEVSDSLGVAHLTPRVLPWQEVHAHAVSVTPSPTDVGHDVDCYGNATTYFQVTDPHTRLLVEATSEVTVAAPQVDPDALRVPWERVRPLASADEGAWRATDFALASPSVELPPAAADYAAASLAPDRPVGECVLDLVQRIHADFAYDAGASTVDSTVAEVFASRAGVCQDFAHVTLACLRAHGLAARYVSGYLETMPPPGRPRLVGADASHAWVAVWLGGDAWFMVDPTNDQAVDDRYVTLAWGRDYADVPPLRGVIFTEAANSTLAVGVDVVRVGKDGPTPAPVRRT